MPTDSRDIPKVFFLSLISADKFRVSDTIRIIGSRCKVFLIPLRQPTNQPSVIGEHRKKLQKEMDQKKRKKEEINLLNLSVNLRILYE